MKQPNPYKTVVDGATYGGQQFTTSPLSKSGNVEITISVTDSRGLTTTTTRTVNVMEYSPPRINRFIVERGNADSTPNSIGNYAIMRIDFAISRLGGRNRNSYKIEYKSNNDYDYRLLGTYSGYEFSGIKNGGNILNGSNTYAFKITVTDFFGSVEAEYDGVPTSSTLFNVNKEGTSMCFGAVSKRTTEHCYDFVYPIYMKDLLPFEGEATKVGDASNPIDSGYFRNLTMNSESDGNVLGFPNYGNILGEYTNQSFVAPQNCWAKVQMMSGWSNTTLNVNGSGVLIQQIQNTNNYPIKTTTLIPLRSGDRVTMSNASATNEITVTLYGMR